ncbi:MAG TPA: hypothetical protein VIJ50_09810, partial [Solirubrobacteraceae bacterium]
EYEVFRALQFAQFTSTLVLDDSNDIVAALEREPPPESPLEALRRFPEGLVTQEVAAIMTSGNDAPDRQAAESTLVELAGEGNVRRVALGDDALWIAAG